MKFSQWRSDDQRDSTGENAGGHSGGGHRAEEDDDDDDDDEDDDEDDEATQLHHVQHQTTATTTTTTTDDDQALSDVVSDAGEEYLAALGQPPLLDASTAAAHVPSGLAAAFPAADSNGVLATVGGGGGGGSACGSASAAATTTAPALKSSLVSGCGARDVNIGAGGGFCVGGPAGGSGGGCGNGGNSGKHRRLSLAQKMQSNLRRFSGAATELKIDIMESSPVNNSKFMTKKIKRHSIHGMMEEENVIRPHQEIQALTIEEKKFLLSVERGDVAGTRRMLTTANETEYININCVDPLGRSALLMAIDNENLEMVELLINNHVDTKDALLHAISEEFVEAVEMLLDHEDGNQHKEGHHSWETLPVETATFTSDITPLILAAHRDNYEIIKILLDRGSTLPMPHDVRCGCDECVISRLDDSLRHSRSRINAYRALASPSLIALSSKDPILTAFELSWELRRLSFLEHEFKNEYQELRRQCQDFATALLDHTRTSNELEVMLNHDPTGPMYEHGERMHLNRLKLAIKLRQKKFVAHPNVQQLLASIWYEGLPGFRRKNMALQSLEIVRIGILFPLFSFTYILAPQSRVGRTMRKPFIKFICHSASYFTFLFLLMLASQRIESVVGSWFMGESPDIFRDEAPTKRGATPSAVEWLILSWVSGLIWSEVKQLWDIGLHEYVHDMWNVIDFVTNSLYVATVALRVVSYFQVKKEMFYNQLAADLPREKWDTWDPMLISEGLFSAANIFSSLKLVYIFSVNPHLGPLQVSLSRMVMDIIKFFFLYVLVLFAFSSGLNQLLWYYADLEKKKCPDSLGYNPAQNASTDHNACIVWRRFANLFETTQTLFWAVFGLVDLDSFELDGIKIFTRFWGMLMFGTYSVINIVVLLNLLIAMMNHSYQLISERADVEWKFARSRLWISYFEEGGTCPPPFNIIPAPKSIWYIVQWIRKSFFGRSKTIKKEHMKTIRRKAKQANEREFKYQQIMRNLVRRYVTVEQRKAESQGVTEDDVNEIKQDISAFRCELVEILKGSGMNTTIASGQGAGGKKNRQKERRLMKGFNLAPPAAVPGMATLPPVGEFIASYEQQQSVEGGRSGGAGGSTDAANADYYGSSTFTGLMNASGVQPRRNHMYSMQQFSSSQSSFSESMGNIGKLSKLSSKLRNPRGGSGGNGGGVAPVSANTTSSHKRRWGTLIDAARSGTGSVSRFIRSRSEDSVCNTATGPAATASCRPTTSSIQEIGSRSNSPGSEAEGITASPTDSNPSVDRPEVQSSAGKPKAKEHHTHLYGFGALAALKRKRKKFSKSRNTSPILEPAATPQTAKSQKILTRAASVPSRSDDQPAAATAAASAAAAAAAMPSPSTIHLQHHQQHQHYPSPHHTIHMPPTESSEQSAAAAATTPVGLIVRSISGLTPSTTDESVKCSTSTSPPSSSFTNTTTGGLQVRSVDRSPTAAAVPTVSASTLPHLPNITPLRGHSNSSYQGWL